MYLLDLLNLQLTLNVLIFLAASMFFFGLTIWLSTGISPSMRRLRKLKNEEHHPGETFQEDGFKVRWIEPAANLILPEKEWRNSHIKKRLTIAGYRTQQSRNIYIVSKVILAFVPSLIIFFPLILMGYFGSDKLSAIIVLVSVSVAGFFSTDLFLLYRIARRQRILTESFPDILDLLVVCVEAGLGLDAAILRVAKETSLSHPELSEELSLVSLELRAGKTRDAALRSLADRTDLTDIKALTSILIQAEHFGTSIASALRDLSDEMRNIRLQRAKEKAAKLPVKMTFPILLFIFPAIFLVVLGPSFIRIFTSLLN